MASLWPTCSAPLHFRTSDDTRVAGVDGAASVVVVVVVGTQSAAFILAPNEARDVAIIGGGGGCSRRRSGRRLTQASESHKLKSHNMRQGSQAHASGPQKHGPRLSVVDNCKGKLCDSLKPHKATQMHLKALFLLRINGRRYACPT